MADSQVAQMQRAVQQSYAARVWLLDLAVAACVTAAHAPGAVRLLLAGGSVGAVDPLAWAVLVQLLVLGLLGVQRYTLVRGALSVPWRVLFSLRALDTPLGAAGVPWSWRRTLLLQSLVAAGLRLPLAWLAAGSAACWAAAALALHTAADPPQALLASLPELLASTLAAAPLQDGVAWLLEAVLPLTVAMLLERWARRTWPGQQPARSSADDRAAAATPPGGDPPEQQQAPAAEEDRSPVDAAAAFEFFRYVSPLSRELLALKLEGPRNTDTPEMLQAASTAESLGLDAALQEALVEAAAGGQPPTLTRASAFSSCLQLAFEVVQPAARRVQLRPQQLRAAAARALPEGWQLLGSQLLGTTDAAAAAAAGIRLQPWTISHQPTGSRSGRGRRQHATEVHLHLSRAAAAQLLASGAATCRAVVSRQPTGDLLLDECAPLTAPGPDGLRLPLRLPASAVVDQQPAAWTVVVLAVEAAAPGGDAPAERVVAHLPLLLLPAPAHLELLQLQRLSASSEQGSVPALLDDLALLLAVRQRDDALAQVLTGALADACSACGLAACHKLVAQAGLLGLPRGAAAARRAVCPARV